MFIRSERLFLRPAWPEDWQEFHALISEESVRRNLARDVWPATPEETREFIQRPRAKLLPHFFVTVPTQTGTRMVGSIGLGADGDNVELGYWIAGDQRGKGYATEAVRAVLNLARAIGHRRILATHFADNAASASVLVKNGFQPTGETRQRFAPGRDGHATANTYAVALDLYGSDAGKDAAGEDDMRAA